MPTKDEILSELRKLFLDGKTYQVRRIAGQAAEHLAAQDEAIATLRAELERSRQQAGCYSQSHIRRVCEMGTSGCNVRHYPRAEQPDAAREASEREVFNIVHRGGLDGEAHQGLRGTFTDADLKAAGQDWGDTDREARRAGQADD